ncbi:hypothetical protein ACQBJO_05645 [Janibacter sp. G349]|uniref:hypothetical protein n=1 Tax=Janibacter sp. G349 TaxID=3405424 RepID=UPI003B793F78
MEPWGADLFGDPCRECGFEWSVKPDDAVAWIADLDSRLRAATASLQGDERLDGWAVTEYVSHIGDNLRQWAERLQTARLTGRSAVSGYDPDALALARGYEQLPVAVALWSAGDAAERWVEVLAASIEEGVVLQHATRGRQRAEDIARNNCHDAHHHIWDIRRIAAGHASAS